MSEITQAHPNRDALLELAAGFMRHDPLCAIIGGYGYCSCGMELAKNQLLASRPSPVGFEQSLIDDLAAIPEGGEIWTRSEWLNVLAARARSIKSQPSSTGGDPAHLCMSPAICPICSKPDRLTSKDGVD